LADGGDEALHQIHERVGERAAAADVLYEYRSSMYQIRREHIPQTRTGI
jgi:hypothetical protein